MTSDPQASSAKIVVRLSKMKRMPIAGAAMIMLAVFFLALGGLGIASRDATLEPNDAVAVRTRAITSRHGRVRIVGRNRLRTASCECYTNTN